MKNLLRAAALAICAIFTVANAGAQVITAERASEIANQFFANGKQKSAAFRSTNATLTQSIDSRAVTGESNDAPTFHILTGANGKGFVIVSGEETENPIIGYSLDGTIDTNNLPDGFVDYITDIDAQVRALRKYNAANPQKAAARSAMQKTNYNATSMGNIKVLLETAKWGQGSPFNTLCFTDATHTKNAKTGCVPTAFAIVMRYHKWPEEGIGKLVDFQLSTSDYIYITDRTYDWDNMPLVYDGNCSDYQINEVAKVMRDLGQAYMVDYGTNETGVSVPGNSGKLETYFNYNYVSGVSQAQAGSIDNWKARIRESLDNNCPIPYKSHNSASGDSNHMFVLDGYTDNDYYHFNWGWSGSGNGWYQLTLMNPTGSDYSWGESSDHMAIFNLTPKKTMRTVTASVSPAGAGNVTVNGSANSAEVIEGTTATLVATANSGYTFSHWSKGEAQVSTEKTYKAPVAAEGNDYVANFLTVGNTRVNVSVSYNSSYGTVTYNSNAVSGTGITPYQNSEVTLVATPLDGYVFNGWTVTKGTNSTNYAGTELTFVAKEDMSVEANFSTAIATYYISEATGTLENSTSSRYTTWSSSEVSGLYLTASYNSNAVEAISFNGGQVKLISAVSVKENNQDVVKNPVTYTLSAPEGYVITAYSMTYKSSSSNYAMTVANAQMTQTLANRNEVLTLSATGLSAQNTEFTVSGANTNYAIQVQEFTVTLQSEGGGSTPTPDPTPTTYTINATAGAGGSVTINGEAVSQKSVNENSTVTLVATPQTGYSFVNWTSGTSTIVSTNATYSFTATGNTSLLANFTQATYTVNVEATEGGSAYIGTKGTTQATAAYNGNVTITAEANDGYRFVEWRAYDSHFSSNAEQDVSVTTDVTYTAVFEAEAQEPEQPEFDGTKEETSYTDAKWFRNNKGSDIDYGTESWGYKVVTENKTSTVTLMVKDKDNSGYFKNNIGFRSVNGVNHPFLFKGTTFTISVPEQHKITGYSITVVGENFNAGTVTYTTGAQMARSNTSTATISGTTPATLNATGLDTNTIEITLGSATASTAGVTITNLDIYYKESEPEYTLGDRITYAQLMSVTKPTHIAVKNLSKTNNWYFAGTTNVADFGNEAVFVWTPKEEGVAGEYYLKTLDGKYLGAAGDNDTPISYTEDVANAAVFTTLKPVAGSTGTSRLDKDSDTGDYVDNDNLLVRFMTKYTGGTGDVTTWINVTNTTSPNHPKYYNGGYGMYTAHFVYAVSVDGVAPELPDVLFPDGAYKIYWQADNRGYLAYHDTDYPNEAKLAGVTYTDCQNIHYAVDQVDLVWYLITADDCKRYLFQAATGKFLGVDTSIQANGTGNKLSTTEAWPIAIEENTNSTRLGHYIITTVINGTNSLLCSGCGTPKEQHPVRWLEVNDNNQKDGGAPLQLVKVDDVTVADNVMNAVLAVINGTDEPEQPADPLAGKYFRLKEKSTGTYMNIYDNATHSDGAKGGVNVTSLSESSDGQIFQFITSGTGYKLLSKTGYYIYCQSWNVDAYSTTSANGTELTLEPTANELEYLIHCEKGYFKIDAVNGNASIGKFVYCNESAKANAAVWVLEEVVMQKVYIKAEIEGWRNDNPNTHLGTITIGGTAMKLTPAHQTASELTMPVVEGTTLAFTRKYRGFEFQGFYIGSTPLGENPTLTADNVATIDENNPLIAKFTATDDVTLFYDDDQFSYRIPAIAKTGTNRLVAVSDYRHSLDDIGRDQHHTGTNRVDLVMRTSDDNGATWSEKQSIAEGTSTFGYGDAAIAANGQDILVMAVAGNVFYPTATATSNNKTYRIYSNNNGASWTKEEVTSNIFGLFDEAYATFFGSGKLAVDPDFNGTGKARVYGAILLKNSARSTNNYVLFSDDWGATWNILGGSKTHIAEADEPKVEILPNGQILLSSRHASGGSRVFNVFTYGNDKAAGEGTWGTAVSGCSNGGSNGTNGEIICLDAKQTNGKPTKILLQSQPQGGSNTWDRKDVTIWYKEIGNETQTPSSIANDWTKGLQVSTVQSAYSAMALQENGEIAFFFEEAPCYGDNNTKGYSMVYVPLTIEEITKNNFFSPNADVEYVPTEFNIVLTDAQDNEYRETIDYIPADVAAVESYLTTTYPFITLGTTGAIADNKYTNTVTLPFKVSNADNAYWHNIYWPSYNPPSGKIGCPIYLSATVGEQYVPKVTADALYGASEYNTLDWADRLSWAVYSVNNSLTFKFKNKSADKYIQVTSVASGNAQNTVYVDEGNATVFTLLKDTGTRNGDYALAAEVGETTGYLCSTSAGYDWATHFEHTNHEGAWVVFQEEEVVSSIQDLNIALNLFGEGALYVINNDVQEIITDLERPNNIKLNTLVQYGTVLDDAMTNWKTLTLTVNDAMGSVTINNETRKTKKAPSGFEFTVVATPANGYRFTHWSNGTTTVSTDASYTFNMPDAATGLTANFEEVSAAYPEVTGNINANNYLTSVTTEGGRTNVNYSANTHPGEKVVTIGTVQIGRGESFSMNLIAYSLGAGSTSAVREDMRYCHASLFTDFDGDRTFQTDAVQRWGVMKPYGTNPYAGGNSNVYGNYDLVMNITANITVPVDAPLGESHVRMIYTNAWKDWPTNGTTTLDKGIVYDIIVEVVEDVENVTITVGVATENTGTVTINGEGVDSKQVAKDSEVTVVATPANGYHFVNWSNGTTTVSTDATYTFTASENTSLVANFEADVVYHTITVSTYYDNNGGTVKVGEEDATSVNVAEGESVRMLATVANGYEFMGWLKDGVIVKNAIDGGLDFEVQGPDYTLYEIKASAEYVAVFSKITETTGLEDGKAYRICGVQGNGRARCIYRDGNTLKWKYDYNNNDVNTIFVAQKNGNAMNLISAVGYHGWKTGNTLGNDEQYNPYAAIKVTYGTRDELRTLYIESGTSSGLFQTNTGGAFSFQISRDGGLTMIATDEATTDFLFKEVDTYAFQVSAADGSNAKLGTVNLPFATTVPAGVTVYGVNDSNEDYVYVAPLELTDNVLPANTPVLIEAAASGKYGFKPAPASANVYETGFAGTLEAEAIPGTTNAYILSYKGVGTPIKMYKLSSTDRTINANKAYYIEATGKASALQFVFGGTTDIEDMEGENGEVEAIYDLQGRKLSEITEPGIYIVGGKKVWIK